MGLFSIDARVDRNKVAVGEAVTLLVTASGQGNLRKLALPRLAPLAGWKTYEPKVDVKIENDNGIAGTQVGRIPAAARAAGADHHRAALVSLLRPHGAALRHPEDAQPCASR